MASMRSVPIRGSAEFVTRPVRRLLTKNEAPLSVHTKAKSPGSSANRSS